MDFRCKCKKPKKLGSDGSSCISKPHPCTVKNGGCSHKCIRKGAGRRCGCPAGFRLGKNKKTCVERNPCKMNGGFGCKGPTSRCRVRGGKAQCLCNHNYQLQGKTCVKKNPCAKNKGGCAHKCSVSGGKAVCSCNAGYKLAANNKGCDRIHPCDLAGKGGCGQVCNKVGVGLKCSCYFGYKLNPDGKTCSRPGPCEGSNGGCAHQCEAVGGKPVCSCNDGFKLAPNKKGCVKIHPCDMLGQAGCAHKCLKDGDAAVCACNDGYELQADGKSCTKVHPCDEGNGGCEGTCNKKGDAAVCSCDEGYTLGKDGKSCEVPPKPRCPLVANCGPEAAQWKHFPNLHNGGAVAYAPAGESLDACKAKCVEMGTCCTALDWNHNANPYKGIRCWFHTQSHADLDATFKGTEKSSQYRPHC